MASPEKRVKKKGGPYLAAAVFCDSVVEGADGAMSAIRIIDHVRLKIPANAPADVLSAKKPALVSLWLLLSFKTGFAKGKHEVRLVMHSPLGKRHVIKKDRVPFRKEPHGGINLKINLNVLIKNFGLFWIDVYLDGKLLTRMPLQISLERVEVPASSSDDLKKPKP
jgi:hypothetical protein